MNKQGPEHIQGWRTQIEIDGVKVDVVAAHHTRKRLPRGHEIARQYGRRGSYSLVDETTHEWRVIASRDLRPATCRQNPSGTFVINGQHVRSTKILEAVETWVRLRLTHVPAPIMKT